MPNVSQKRVFVHRQENSLPTLLRYTKHIFLKRRQNFTEKTVLHLLRVFWGFVNRPMKRKELWGLHLNTKSFLVLLFVNKVKTIEIEKIRFKDENCRSMFRLFLTFCQKVQENHAIFFCLNLPILLKYDNNETLFFSKPRKFFRMRYQTSSRALLIYIK